MIEIANLNEISIDLVEMIAPLLALTLSIGIGLWAKDALDALVKGLTFRADTAIQEGCEVYIDGDRATIIKIGVFKTTFQITNGRGVTWRYVPNKRIEYLKIEKVIQAPEDEEHIGLYTDKH